MKKYHILNDNNEEVFDIDLFNQAVKDGTVVTTNSVSGGQTSAYIAKHYPADYNIFSLVRTDDPKLMFPDKKLRQMVSDKIGREFIGTMEENKIIHTIMDLEQYIGREITWLTGPSFDEIIDMKIGLPNGTQRYCTSMMKIEPMSQWHYENIGEPTLTRIGFRVTEQRRAHNMLNKCNEEGLVVIKVKIGKHKSGRNKWMDYRWQMPDFPLTKDGIRKDDIVEFWKGKPVRFAWRNNCVGCLHRNPILLNHISKKFPDKFQWFIDQEKAAAKRVPPKKNGQPSSYARFREEFSYEQIKNHKTQLELFDSDFNDCDSGYCGL